MYRPLIKPVSYIKSFRAPVNVGIVGSRSYRGRWLVKMLVKELPRYVTVISSYGGLVDKTAVSMAKELNMKYREHKPDWIYRRRGGGLVRNKQIAQDDLRCLVAFVDTDRSKGTAATIKYAMKEKVKVFLMKSDPLDSRPASRRPKCVILKKSKNRRAKRLKSYITFM